MRTALAIIADGRKVRWITLLVAGAAISAGCRGPHGVAEPLVPYCEPPGITTIESLGLPEPDELRSELETEAVEAVVIPASEVTASEWTPTAATQVDNVSDVVETPPEALPPAPMESTPSSPSAMPPSALPEFERLPLDVMQVRAAALEGNFSLRIEIVSPAIAREQISEEAARFQATFAAPLSHNEIVPPSANPGSFTTRAIQNQRTVFDSFNPSFNVPLLSGGQLSINQSIDRLDADAVSKAYDTTLGFSFSQPLLRRAGVEVNTAGIRIAHVQTTSANAHVKLAATKVLGDVERAFWNLYLAQKQRDIAQQQVEIGERQVANTRRLIQANLFAEIDEQRALTGLYTRQAALYSTTIAVRFANRELKRLMQHPQFPVEAMTEIETATHPRPQLLELDRDRLADFAQQNRMEMFQLQMDLLANQYVQLIETNGRLPRIDLVARNALLGNGGTLSRSYEQLLGKGYNDWSVQVIGEIPLPNGVDQAADARRRQAVLRRLQLMISMESLCVLIQQEVNNAIDRIELNWYRVLAARNGVFAAENAYIGEQRQFQLGQRNSTDVLIAADRLAIAQQQEVQALTDFEIAKVDLAVATGTTLGLSQVHWTPLNGSW